MGGSLNDSSVYLYMDWGEKDEEERREIDEDGRPAGRQAAVVGRSM
jgi:hypothetical protein